MAPAFSKFAISVSFGVAGDSCSGLSLNMMSTVINQLGASPAAGSFSTYAAPIPISSKALRLSEIVAKPRGSYEEAIQIEGPSEIAKGHVVALKVLLEPKGVIDIASKQHDLIDIASEQHPELRALIEASGLKIKPQEWEEFQSQLAQNLASSPKKGSMTDSDVIDALQKELEEIIDKKVHSPALQEVAATALPIFGRQLLGKKCPGHASPNIITHLGDIICHWRHYPIQSAIFCLVVVGVIVALVVYCCFRDEIEARQRACAQKCTATAERCADTAAALRRFCDGVAAACGRGAVVEPAEEVVPSNNIEMAAVAGPAESPRGSDADTRV